MFDMADISVYYDEVDDMLAPKWMIVRFENNELNWSDQYFHVQVDAPFKRLMGYDFDDQILGLSIAQTELTVNNGRTGAFGVYLPAVLQRINKMRGDKYTMPFRIADIRQFVILMSDIEEILQMNVGDVYAWR